MARSDSVEGGMEEHDENSERLSAGKSQGHRTPAGRHMAIEEVSFLDTPGLSRCFACQTEEDSLVPQPYATL